MSPEQFRKAAEDWEPWLGAVVETLDPPIGGASTGPLAGWVMGMKDLLAVAGIPRRCGAPGLVSEEPQDEHATVVARSLDAGATVVATMALHQLAYGIITPQTRNPRAPDRVAGGSSGGSAAAIAAGMIDASIGSDTGGSIRIPAACCGVVGLKTTRGLVPLTGVQPLAWSLDTVGPLARDVEGCARLLDAIAGPDPADPDSVVAPAGATRAPGSPIRVGVPREVRRSRLDPDVREVWEARLEDLAGGGASVVDVDLPHLDGAGAANSQVLGAEAAAIHRELFDADPDAFWPSVGERLAKGGEMRAPVAAVARRHGVLLRAELRHVLEEVDVLVTPTLPCRVPPVATDPIVVDGVEEPVTPTMTRLTGPWNLAGVPAGSVPGGADGDGAPVGIQVVGPWFGDHLVLEVMATVEASGDGPWPAVTR